MGCRHYTQICEKLVNNDIVSDKVLTQKLLMLLLLVGAQLRHSTPVT